MPVKVLDEFGMGFFSDILDGMDWARTHGADIVNLSLGGMLDPTQVALIQPTFTAARAAGILVVAASGNSGSPIMEYPAGLHGVVSVGAVDQDGPPGRLLDLQPRRRPDRTGRRHPLDDRR